MIKITDQYFWNFVFLAFFGFLVAMATIILETESRIPLADLGLFDVGLITLAAWRLTRFLAEDLTTKFIREQFYEVKETARALTLEKPLTGPRRTVLDIINSPWSLGLGMTALVLFLYLLSPYFVYPLIIAAVAAIVALLSRAAQYLEFLTKREGE
jgi:Protein of unknown function (DUF1360)